MARRHGQGRPAKVQALRTLPGWFVRAGLVSLVSLLAACDEGPDANDESERPLPPPTTEPDAPGTGDWSRQPSDRAGGGEAPAGFRLEPWPIGDRWYLYDGRTHTLSPRDLTYLVSNPEGTALVRILGYYGARGESGVFSLRWRSWDGSAWSAPEERMLEGNVKDAPICLGLSPFRVRDCGTSDVGLVLRTDRRVLPAAGFVVANPALYEAGHPAGRPAQLVVLEGDRIAAPPDDPMSVLSRDEAPSVARDVAAWPIGARWASPEGRVWIQATTGFQIAQWQALPAEGDPSAGLTFQVRCTPLAMSPLDQTPLEGEPSAEDVPWPDGARTTLLRLCPEVSVVETAAELFHGTWPDSRDYDLLIERHEDGFWLRQAPGSLLWDWTGDEAQRPAAIEDVTLPLSLWE